VKVNMEKLEKIAKDKWPSYKPYQERLVKDTIKLIEYIEKNIGLDNVKYIARVSYPIVENPELVCDYTSDLIIKLNDGGEIKLNPFEFDDAITDISLIRDICK